MKTLRFLLFLSVLALASGWARAQAPSPAPAASPDEAKLADFEKRFKQGKDLEADGKLTEALAVFDGIIADSPQAKGSLREAGIINMKLNQPEKAAGYFEKLHALVPDYPGAIESLIQINQTLKRDVKVEFLLKEFRSLYEEGKVPQPYFVRERLHSEKGNEVVMTEFFNYTKKPYTLWMAEMFGPDGNLQRRLLLNYDSGGTLELRAKGGKLANAEQFLLIEDVLKNGQVTRVDAYFQMFTVPEYPKVRSTMVAIFGGAYKPVYSQDVKAPAASAP